MSKSTNTITSQCTTIYTTCGMRYYVPLIQCHGIDMLCTLLCQQTFSRREKGCKTWDMVNRLTMTRLNQHHKNHPMRGEQPTLTDTCKFDVSILNQQKNLFSYNHGMYYKKKLGRHVLVRKFNQLSRLQLGKPLSILVSPRFYKKKCSFRGIRKLVKANHIWPFCFFWGQKTKICLQLSSFTDTNVRVQIEIHVSVIVRCTWVLQASNSYSHICVWICGQTICVGSSLTNQLLFL